MILDQCTKISTDSGSEVILDIKALVHSNQNCIETPPDHAGAAYIILPERVEV